MNSKVVAELDEEIRQLQELKRLASNPQMLERMRRLLGPNGETGDPTITAEKKSVGRPKNPQAPRATRRGALTDAILDVCGRTEGNIKASFVQRKLEDAGFIFTAGDPRVAVSLVLQKLAKHHKLRIVTPGRGSAESIYSHHIKSGGD